MNFETFALLANGIVTIGVSVPAARTYLRFRPTSTPFALWAVGFVIYGTQILLRLYFSLAITDALPAVMVLLAFSFFIFGTFVLVNEFNRALIIFALLVGSSVLLYTIGFTAFALGLGIIGLYGSMVYGAYIIIHKLGVRVTSFIGGWTLLFVSNFLQPMHPPAGFIDVVASEAKIIIAIGMNDQRFTTTLARILREQRSIARVEAAGTGYIRAVISQISDKTKQLDWLNEHIRQGTITKRLMYIVAAYDAPLTRDVEQLASIYGMYLVKIVPVPRNYRGHRSSLTIEVGDNRDDFEEFLSLLLQMSVRRKLDSEVIILGVSWLAKKWGDEDLLSYLTKKLSVLKEGDIVLTLLLYPELHSPEALIGFRRLAQEVIEL